MQHASLGHDEVYAIEWEDVVEILKGRLVLLHHLVVVGDHNLIITGNHDLPRFVVDADVVHFGIAMMYTFSDIISHRKDLNIVVIRGY